LSFEKVISRTFCIAREFLRMTFSFVFSFANLGDDRVDLVLPGVDGDDGAVLPLQK
jgi:hypothetical protein